MSAVPAPKRFSAEEYYKLSELGFIHERTELIHGEILEMPPIGPQHAFITNRLPDLLKRAFGGNVVVRNQIPLDLGDSQPQPDVAVVEGPDDQYRTHHPRSALLVIEVSHSTLNFDRDIKGPIYAEAGIPEFWIIDLNARRIEVRRAPMPGVGYTEIKLVLPGNMLAPLFSSEASISVDDLLSPP